MTTAVDTERLLRFGPLSRPVRFTACEELIAPLQSIFRGWDIADVAEGSPLVRLKKTRRGYRRVSPWLTTPSRCRDKIRETVVGAICGFHFELIDWYLAEHPHQLFVHGAAVEFGDQLALFPATAKAGKSTLSVQLAADGRRIYCDDVLPIDVQTLHGIALGIVPRLRPPWPDGASEVFRRFVEDREGPNRGNRYYVDTRDGELAPLGSEAPIGAVVLLDRREDGPARLMPVDPADALEQIIVQNFAVDVPSPRILDALHRVVTASPCYDLMYASTAEASALLRHAFADGMTVRWQRNPAATERTVGRTVFLANEEIGTVYRLNDTVAALWHLLAEPTTIADAVATFCEAFPDEDTDELEGSVHVMVEDLIEEGLVEPA